MFAYSTLSIQPPRQPSKCPKKKHFFSKENHKALLTPFEPKNNSHLRYLNTRRESPILPETQANNQRQTTNRLSANLPSRKPKPTLRQRQSRPHHLYKTHLLHPKHHHHTTPSPTLPRIQNVKNQQPPTPLTPQPNCKTLHPTKTHTHILALSPQNPRPKHQSRNEDKTTKSPRGRLRTNELRSSPEGRS